MKVRASLQMQLPRVAPTAGATVVARDARGTDLAIAGQDGRRGDSWTPGTKLADAAERPSRSHWTETIWTVILRCARSPQGVADGCSSDLLAESHVPPHTHAKVQSRSYTFKVRSPDSMRMHALFSDFLTLLSAGTEVCSPLATSHQLDTPMGILSRPHDIKDNRKPRAGGSHLRFSF